MTESAYGRKRRVTPARREDPLPAGETACLISLTITGDTGDNPPGSLVARVYTSADSVAWPH